jgi:hypothetical protein
VSRTTRYTFIIARAALDRQMVLTGFLDMLRYDAATVIDADSSFVVLQTTNHEPTRTRWASFGLYPLAEQKGDYPDITYLKQQALPKLPTTV